MEKFEVPLSEAYKITIVTRKYTETKPTEFI